MLIPSTSAMSDGVFRALHNKLLLAPFKLLQRANLVG